MDPLTIVLRMCRGGPLQYWTNVGKERDRERERDKDKDTDQDQWLCIVLESQTCVGKQNQMKIR